MEWRENQTPWANAWQRLGKWFGGTQGGERGAGDTFDYVIVGSGAAGSVLATG